MKASTILLLLLLTACKDKAPETATEQSRTPRVFDPLIETIDKANSVEETLQSSAAARRKQLEEAQ